MIRRLSLAAILLLAQLLAPVTLAAAPTSPGQAPRGVSVTVRVETPREGLARPVLIVRGLMPPGAANLSLNVAAANTSATLECRIESGLAAALLRARGASGLRASLELDKSPGSNTTRIRGTVLVEGRNWSAGLSLRGAAGLTDDGYLSLDISMRLVNSTGNVSLEGVGRSLEGLLARAPAFVDYTLGYNRTSITLSVTTPRSVAPLLAGLLSVEEGLLTARISVSAGRLVVECRGTAHGDMQALVDGLTARLSLAGLPPGVRPVMPAALKAESAPNGSVIIRLPVFNTSGKPASMLGNAIARYIQERYNVNASYAGGPSSNSPGALAARTNAGSTASSTSNTSPSTEGKSLTDAAIAIVIIVVIAIVMLAWSRRPG